MTAFRDLIFEKSVAAFHGVEEGAEPVFFDRSFLEALSCSKGLSVAPPSEHLDAVRTLRFNQTVFITPPWEEIFTNDEERKTTFEAAVIDYETNKATYEEAGYMLVEVPKEPLNARTDFVLEKVKATLFS